MPRPPERRARWYELSEAASLGIEMAVAIAIGAWGGRWLENNVTHWKPWTFYIGLTIGIGAAVNGVVRTARKFQRIVEHEERMEAEAAAAREHTDRSSQPADMEKSPHYGLTNGNPAGADRRQKSRREPRPDSDHERPGMARFNNPYNDDDGGET